MQASRMPSILLQNVCLQRPEKTQYTTEIKRNINEKEEKNVKQDFVWTLIQDGENESSYIKTCA